MIKITFPDGSVREYESGVTGLQIAESISHRLAQDVVACGVNGETVELNRPINEDAAINLYKFEDEQGKHAFWHTSAHLLAEALQELYPGIQFGFGPAIENGFFYDVLLPDGKQISEGDFKDIENKMIELARKDEPLVRKEVAKAECIAQFQSAGQVYKVEHIEQDLEDGTISTYTQGNFTDLCKGPHLTSTGIIKAVKLMSVAGAFWRGDASKDQMQRIYGISFPKQKMLTEYLTMLEEAKKRDHRKIGKEMELFMFSERVGKGLPIWLPKGTDLRLRLQDMLRKIQRQYGYQEVITPNIGGKNLYQTSGHWDHYGKDSFQPIQTPEEGEEYLLKPMNCPHHCEVYANKPRSYKELPFRCAEFGTVYRYEQSGELHGLTRVRCFTQDDAHIFMLPEQITDEIKGVVRLTDTIYKQFGFKYKVELSTRPENSMGSEEDWELATSSLKKALDEMNIKYEINEGDGAFYGPKIDFHLQDSIGRTWQCGTIQLDFQMPQRFELEYVGEDGKKHRPIMIHRAIFGSIERFIGILIEHFAGKFPVWLAPNQVKILPITDRNHDYAEGICKKLNALGVRATLDDRSEKVGYKIREAKLEKVPYILVVGDQEQANGTVNVNKRDVEAKQSLTVDEFVSLVCNDIKEKIAF